MCFSVFEHLDRYEKALSEVARVLRPGGYFLLGMPAVNKMMEMGFRMIAPVVLDTRTAARPVRQVSVVGLVIPRWRAN